MKVFNNIFFHLIEKFRVLTQADHMRKRRNTTEVLSRCSGLENSSVATIG